MARYCDPDANVQSGERFAEQSMLNTPLPRLSTDSIGGLSSPTVNWNHTRLRLQNLVFCGANACSDRKVMQLAGRLSRCPDYTLGWRQPAGVSFALGCRSDWGFPDTFGILFFFFFFDKCFLYRAS